MKVRELIQDLLTSNQDLEVYLPGNEDEPYIAAHTWDYLLNDDSVISGIVIWPV